jgi:ankyrin repeat protein
MDDYGSNEIEQIGWHDGTQALYWAVLLGFRETATILYDRKPKPDVNHIAGKYGCPLQAAAYVHDNDMVNFLIDGGANPNLEGGYYGTALQAAVEGGDERIVENLLQAGADPNCEVQQRPFKRNQMQVRVADTLLLIAIESRNVKTIQMMIQFGANIDSSKLLSGGIRCENMWLIHTLLQATSIGDYILDEWLILAVRQAHKGIIKLLIEAGANPNSSDDCNVHAFAADAILQQGEMGKATVECLIDAGFKVSGDHNLLIAAIREDLDPMAKLLLLSGADIHGHTDGTGDALMTAAGRGNDTLVKALLAAGANPKAQHPVELSDMRMHSALIRVMIYGIESLDEGIQRSLAIVQRLINAGVDVNDGGDALCEAIMCFYTDHLHWRLHDQTTDYNKNSVKLMVQCLLVKGADLGGPLGAIPSVICTAPSKDTMDLVLFMFRDDPDNKYRRQLLDEMHQNLEEKFDMHRRLVTSCTMIAHDDTIILLKEELETKTPDLARVCEILSAACWSFRRPRRWSKPEEEEDRLRHILQTMVDAMEPNHSLFDRLLTGDTLGHSMNLYMRQATPRKHVTKEYCLTKVRACLTEILSKSRPVSMDEIASAD